VELKKRTGSCAEERIFSSILGIRPAAQEALIRQQGRERESKEFDPEELGYGPSNHRHRDYEEYRGRDEVRPDATLQGIAEIDFHFLPLITLYCIFDCLVKTPEIWAGGIGDSCVAEYAASRRHCGIFK
jgi:hypothetical protein